MKTRIITVAIAFALVGACAAPASAAPVAPSVTGIVDYRGTPKAGISVGWFSPSDQTYKSVVSATDGSYTLPLPAAGEEYVLYSNLDMKNVKQSRVNKTYVGVFYGDGDTRDYAFQTLEPYVAGTDADEVDIDLAKPGSLLGVGDAFMDQTVYLNTLGDTTVRSTIGEEERTIFSNLVPGDYRLELPGDPEGVTALDQVFTVAEGEMTTFSLDSVISGRISGVVTSAAGKKIPYLQMTATATDESEARSFQYLTYTDSQGRYVFNGLRESSYAVTFGSSSVGGYDKGWVPKTVTVSGVNNATTVKSNASLAVGGRIRATIAKTATSSDNEFTLVAPNGKKLDLEIWQKTGTLNFPDLATGTYTLYFTNSQSARYGVATVAVKAGETSHVGAFSRTKKGINIYGAVYGLDSGSSLKNIRVTASAPGLPTYYDLKIDKNGYGIIGIVAGNYTFRVSVPGREEGTRDVSVTGPNGRFVGLTAGPKLGKATAKLQVNGEPVPYGYLEISGDTDDTLYGVITDGAYSGIAEAGAYDTVIDFWSGDLFQANSPYWVALPEGTLPITISSGATTKLGTIELDALPTAGRP